MVELPAEVASFLRSRLEPIARASDMSWAHRQAEVWLIEREQGREVFVKRHARKEKLLREASAYETWVPFIAEHAPELIAVDRDRGLLVLGKASGQMAKEVALTPAEERAVYRLAGEVLAKFHAIPLETVPCIRKFAPQPELRDAFSEGCGVDLLRRHAEFYQRHLAFFAMSTVVWARQNRDPAFEAEARALIERLRTGDAAC